MAQYGIPGCTVPAGNKGAQGSGFRAFGEPVAPLGDMAILVEFGKKGRLFGNRHLQQERTLNIRTLGYPEFDDEGRIVMAEFDSVTIISAYFPNSQAEGARLPYKLDFCAAIMETCGKLAADGKTSFFAVIIILPTNP